MAQIVMIWNKKSLNRIQGILLFNFNEIHSNLMVSVLKSEENLLVWDLVWHNKSPIAVGYEDLNFHKSVIFCCCNHY